MFGVAAAWRPSTRESGRTLQVPANYGGDAGLIGWQHTPTVTPTPAYDPHIPQFNNLVPIQWNEIVLHPDEVSALQQAGLLQTTLGLPASYSVPGTASLGG